MPRLAVKVAQAGAPAAGDVLDQAEALLSDPQPQPEPEPEPLEPLAPAKAGALSVEFAAAPEEVGGAESVAAGVPLAAQLTQQSSLYLSPRGLKDALGTAWDSKSSSSLNVSLTAEEAARTVHIGRIPSKAANVTKLKGLLRAAGAPEPDRITICAASDMAGQDRDAARDSGLTWALATFDTPGSADEVCKQSLDTTGRQHFRATMVDRNLLAAKSGAALGKIASMHHLAIGGDIIGHNRWQVDPQGKFKHRWDIIVTLLCLYVALFVPYRIGFQIEMCPGHFDWFVELITDIVFMADIALTFCTPIVTHSGHIERNKAFISRHYMHGWFIIDLLAVLPISYIALIFSTASSPCSDDGVGASTRLFKVLRLIRLAKLLRLAKLREVIRMMVSDLDALEDSFKYVKIFVAMIAIAYICHLFACMWFYFGTLGEDAGVATEGGWVDKAGIMQASNSVKYLWSVYWAITVLSTVGYGDVVAHTNAEKVFSIVAELFGCVIFATLIGGLGSIMMSKKLLDQKVEYQLEELREFGRVKRLPKSLQKRMRLILEEAYRETAFDENKVLMQLPAAMQKEVHQHIHESMLAVMPLFQNLPESEDEILKQLLSAFKPLVVQPFDPVYEEHSPAFDFFVIISGEITLTREGGNYSRVLKKGSFFGERELFFSRRFGSMPSTAVSHHGSGTAADLDLPLVGRKRHQTAIVSSSMRAELKFIAWPQIMSLRRTSRTIFEKLREAAAIRANSDDDIKTQSQRRTVVDTLFVQFDAQNFSAKVIQRRFRRFAKERAVNKLARQSDRELLEQLLGASLRTEERLEKLDKRMDLLEQSKSIG